MREILFRGKPLGNLHGKFIYGSLGVIDTDLCAIYHCFEFNDDEIQLVDIGTVGQYTGLTDKNGKKIFEGDILKPDYDNSSYYRVAWDSGKLHLNIEEYCFNDSEGKALWLWCENIADYQINGCVDNCEIIGNIYDNPELLEVEE